MLGWELRPRHVERETAVPRERFRKTSERLLGRQFGPGSEGALAQRQRPSPHKDGGVGPFLRAQTFANGAPAEWTVKGKMARLQRLATTPAHGVSQAPAKPNDSTIRLRPARHPVA